MKKKHDITFELASTIFYDPNLLTVADSEHSETQDRWFSVGIAGNGVLLSVVYLWSDADPAAIKMRHIGQRATMPSACSMKRPYEQST